MDYIGKWKMKAIMSGDENDNFDFKPIDDLIAECKDEDEKKDLISQKNSFIDVNSNGKLYFYMAIPDEFKNKPKEELLKIFKEEGIENPIIVDGCFATEDESYVWEMRGNDLFVNMGDTGCTYDDDGNEVPCDPWVKWNDSNDEYLHFFTSIYERI